MAGGCAAGALTVRCAARSFGVQLRTAAAVVACVVVAVVLAVRLRHSPLLAPLLTFGWFAVAISGIDLRTHLIPTRLLRTAAAAAVPLICAAAFTAGGAHAAVRTVAAAAIGGAGGWLVMHLAWLAARGGLGYGDVRLGGYLGLHLGLAGFDAVLTGLLAGFAIASAVGLFCVVVLRRAADHRFALGPSLVVGALGVLWWTAPVGPIS